MPQSALAFCNLLLAEPEVVKGAWRHTTNVEFALDEVQDLMYLDRARAQSHLLEMRARVLSAYRLYFAEDFCPEKPLKQSTKLVSMYLPELAQRLHYLCMLHDVQSSHHA